MQLKEETLTIDSEQKAATFRLGCFPAKDYTEFRLFCRRADSVEVEIFDRYEQREGERFKMNQNGHGIWQITVKGDHIGKFYGYRIVPPENDPAFNGTEYLIADPWCKMAATTNHYLQYPKSMIVQREEFDWQGDKPVAPADPRDLVIYEAHLKDLTGHPSSGASMPGTYNGFIEKGIEGGISHLKKLGVNAVEFLPLQKFAYFEPPHNEPIAEGVINTWNFYGRNYWGYMTSFFFVPETIFASDGSIQPGDVTGKSSAAIRELKTLIRELHKNGISVIMDVVYNHVSQYDINPFKFIDREYYFRLNGDGRYISESGCGNDFQTEATMARKVIVDSILYWMEEFHVDGFRFDLANLIDDETLRSIRDEARKINQNVILIGEPWGGGYNPVRFSELGWSAWNDQIRNGVKGSDPKTGKGFIFGDWQWETSRGGLENFLRGTLLDRDNGRFHDASHSVNYLESHDGYTLGDFIRIGLDPQKADKTFQNRNELVKLSETEMRLAKLAALYLFASQGIAMIHAGQEFARTKYIVPQMGVNDIFVKQIDHNSYEKDNETNYLNFKDIKANKSLFDYYVGLIKIRLQSPALRKSPPEALEFQPCHDSLLLVMGIDGSFTDDAYDYVVVLNGNPFAIHKVGLPNGLWEVVASGEFANAEGFDIAANELIVPSSSGFIIRKLRDRV